MLDRNSSYNQKSSRRSSHEEEDWFDAAFTDRGASSRRRSGGSQEDDSRRGQAARSSRSSRGDRSSDRRDEARSRSDRGQRNARGDRDQRPRRAQNDEWDGYDREEPSRRARRSDREQDGRYPTRDRAQGSGQGRRGSAGPVHQGTFRSSYGRASDYAYDREEDRGYEDRSRRRPERPAQRGGDRARRSEPEIYVGSSRMGGGRFSILNSLPFGPQGGHAAAGYSPVSQYVALAIPVVALILIILLVVFIVSSVQSCTAAAEPEEPEVVEVQPMSLHYEPSVLGFDAVADPGSSVAGFTLASEGQSYMPTLSEEGQAQIASAMAPFTDNSYTLGFSILDLQTGSGYAYNLDAEVYGASSFKGPVLIYGCQEALEPGILSISTVQDSCEGAIISSDNKCYYQMRALFEEYAEESLVTWLANMNIDSDVETDTSFPHYSARISVKLWMNAYLYFTSADSDPDVVSWAQDLFSKTEVSMLRAGVDPTFALVTDGGEVSSSAPAGSSSLDVVVYDKAGWLNGSTDDGLCDAGIVIDDGKAYLISVMSGAPDSDSNREAMMNLISALWQQRSSLAPSEGYVLSDAASSSEGNSGNAGDTNAGDNATQQ